MHIVFTGGGTLGPVTPLIAVMQALRASHPDAVFSWIGTQDGPEAGVVRASGIQFHAISAGKLRRYLDLRNLTDLVKIVRGFFEARRLLKSIGASVVVSAGGFVAVPVAWAAWTLGIPVHVHQQDVVPGLANRLTLPVARSMSVALERSVADFPGMHAVWTGNPVRPELAHGSRQEAMERFGLDASTPTILVVGGGTGATRLNSLVQASLPKLTARTNVIHIAGTGKTQGPARSHRYAQEALLTDLLPHALALADIVVTRAGMGMLSELASLGKPIVIVPMANSHQLQNAQAYAHASKAPIIDELTADPDTFADVVLGLLADPSRLSAISKGLSVVHRPDATEKIAAQVVALTKSPN